MGRPLRRFGRHSNLLPPGSKNRSGWPKTGACGSINVYFYDQVFLCYTLAITNPEESLNSHFDSRDNATSESLGKTYADHFLLSLTEAGVRIGKDSSYLALGA